MAAARTPVNSVTLASWTATAQVQQHKSAVCPQARRGTTTLIKASKTSEQRCLLICCLFSGSVLSKRGRWFEKGDARLHFPFLAIRCITTNNNHFFCPQNPTTNQQAKASNVCALLLWVCCLLFRFLLFGFVVLFGLPNLAGV